jgi:hypothetical protein
MTRGPANLLELRRKDRKDPSWLLNLVLPEVGGGRFDESHLTGVASNPKARALRVSGLDQATFEALVTRHGPQFSAIEFWKCPRISDLTPLEDLPGLQLVSFYWNQRATRLWDLSRTPQLVGLHFDDFTSLRDLTDLERGEALVELAFGDAVWDKSVFESLAPLAALSHLRSLKFSAKRIDDGRVEPLGALQELEALSFSRNQFTTRQVAWLRARLPEALESDSLEPVNRLSSPLEYDGKVRDVMLVGKRKPLLNSVDDAARIRKHIDDFRQMVDSFRADPRIAPA